MGLLLDSPVLRLPLGGDDGLQVLALPSLLVAVAISSLGHFFGLVDGNFGAIHAGRPRHAQARGRRRGGEGGAGQWCALCDQIRSGRVVARAAPHRRAVQGGAVRCRAVQCRAREEGLPVAVSRFGLPAVPVRAAAVGCDFFNCWGLVLALASGLTLPP